MSFPPPCGRFYLSQQGCNFNQTFGEMRHLRGQAGITVTQRRGIIQPVGQSRGPEGAIRKPAVVIEPLKHGCQQRLNLTQTSESTGQPRKLQLHHGRQRRIGRKIRFVQDREPCCGLMLAVQISAIELAAIEHVQRGRIWKIAPAISIGQGRE